MVITYTNGPVQWNTVTYGTLRIVIPAGWSVPSTTAGDKGYYTVSVSGGTLVLKGLDLVDNAILVRVRSLAATIQCPYLHSPRLRLSRRARLPL
jgi:hypothetical protein